MGETSRGKRKLSVKTHIQLTLLTAVLSVVMTGFGAHALSKAHDADRMRDGGAVTLGQAFVAQLRPDAVQTRVDLERACDRLVELPAVLAVRVWDQSGEIAADASVAGEFLALVELPRHPGEPEIVVERAELPPGIVWDRAFVRRVEADLGVHPRKERPARMAVLLAMSTGFGAPGVHATVLPYLVPAVVGIIAFIISSRRLHRQVSRPLLELAEAAVSAGDDGPSCHTDRDDELGAIARSLQGLHDGLGAWRERAAVIERRMDSHIAAESQRITRDLRRVQRDAWQDPLTGINNRRMLENKFGDIFAAQRDARQDLSVIMFDLDHFKTLNDSLGHAAGDHVLAFAGELLGQCSRADDIAIRYGGDEFLLILPGQSAVKALALANRIIAMFAQRVKTMVPIRPAPTMSAGVASLWNNRPAGHGELLRLADRGLYMAKQAGRGRACVYEFCEVLAQ